MLPEVYRLPARKGKEDPTFCPYYQKKDHTLERFVSFRKIFDKEHNIGEVLFEKTGHFDLSTSKNQ